ncbi:unnamed protein product [Triticum turgidum subsp. durum]|uniref:Wall-associated receptor kinase galacturonan-binding domain-containing protein n=1 Tax=Triticum turgidum subsp. durum TaxID=4567 RepID=A0A9R1Q6W8_TRITD|nr:unnamed protein product [Triticum turgidum subsp. durum]
MFPWRLGPCLLVSAVVIAASTMPARMLVAAAACEPERCGNVSVSPPFGIVSGSEENRCAQSGFQVHCTDDVPYLGYYERGFGLQILNIFYNNSSLLVSDVHKLGDFNHSGEKGCHVPKANTATKTGPPFSISSLNRNLIFYNCTRAPSLETVHRAGLAATVCRNNTFVRAGGRYNATGVIAGSYDLPGCNVTAVPVLGATGKVNASHYIELISDGFLLTWRPLTPSAGSGVRLLCLAPTKEEETSYSFK